MIRLWFTIVVLLITTQLFSQTKVTGTVKSSLDQKELYDVEVTIVESGETAKTDRLGYFQFVEVAAGNYTISIIQDGYEPYQEQIEVGEEPLDLGEIFITYDPQSINVGVITLSADELASDEASAQSSVGLLQSSRDVFARTTAFELGAFWFRPRGYDNKNSEVYFNGTRMNKIDNDRVDFGNWGGLNDITRYPTEITYGLDPSDYAFGDFGGVTYFDTRPSQLRTGASLSYSMTNRSYRQRVMATYNSGLNENGFGYVISGSRRWAEEGRIDGTFYDAYAYFLGLEKKFNDKHTLNLTVMGAPYRRSTNSPNTQEVYDLMGTGYNAYWGYQDGEKRNERVRKNHEPLGQLTHHWNFNEKSKLTTTLAYQFGKNGASRLDWWNAANPSPIYYRRMPSWAELNGDIETANDLTNLWQNDESWSQINWDRLYTANANANERDAPANYYLVSDVNEDNILSFSTNLRTQLSEDFTLFATLNYQNTQSHLYREIDDLLGGSYVLDQDDFADAGIAGDSDTNNPNFQAGEGDKIQYNYEIDHQNYNAFVAGEWKLNNFEVTIGAKIANTSFQRNGLFDYYRYDNSFGKSEKQNFFDYGGKLQLLYKLDGRNFVTMNGAYFTVAPTFSDVFPQGRTNNISIPGIESSKITSGDINYILRAPKFKGRATVFYTKTTDETDTAFGYLALSDSDSDQNLFTAEVLSGVDKQFLGTELSLEAQLTTTLTASAVASIGQYTYANNPDLYYFSDDFGIFNEDDNATGYDYRGKAYLKDYKLSGTPQKGFSLGLQYRDPHYWWIGATGNMLIDNYVDVTGSKRTTGFVTNQVTGNILPDVTEAGLRDLLRQEKFSDEFMLNLNAGKTFRFGDYYMGVSLSVNNVLDNKDYRTGGFEQLRLANYTTASDEGYQRVFGNRYWYDQGLSYFFNVFLRF